MCTRQITFITSLCVALMLSDHGFAQRGNAGRMQRAGGMMRGNGMAGGGRMQQGDGGMGDMMRCMQGQSSGAQRGQGMDGNMMRRMSGFGQTSASRGNRMSGSREPTQQETQMSLQFMRAAGQFDQDHDQQLNSDEVRRMAGALLAEMQRSRPPVNTGRTNARRGTTQPGMPSEEMSQLTQRFVTNAMTFDANGDGTLNAAETQRMAIALMRSRV